MIEVDYKQMVENLYSPEEAIRVAGWETFTNYFEPLIAPAVRMRRLAPNLRSLSDTADRVQSVVVAISSRPAYWQPVLSRLSFDAARRLILATARNRLVQFIRAQHAQCRDARRTTAIDREFDLADAAQDDPAERAVTAEEEDSLDGAIRQACRDEGQYHMIRELLRGEGYVNVGPRYNLSAAAARMVYERFLKRLHTNLGIES